MKDWLWTTISLAAALTAALVIADIARALLKMLSENR